MTGGNGHRGQVHELPRVVIVGAGFAGLAAARVLAGRPIDTTVVDQHNFHTFQPLLYQVATAGLEPADVAYPVRAIFGREPNVSFRCGRVDAVDLDGRRVQLEDGSALPYDYLVLATGAAANFFGISGAARFAEPLYTVRDARRLRNHLLSTLESVDAHPDRYRGGAPVFVVVGGGPTGVETAGALVELIAVSVRRDRLRIDPDRTRVILVDVAPRLLSGFSETAGRYAADTLRGRGVEIHLGERVAEVAAGGVRLADGTTLPADVVVWAGGVTVAGTLADSLPVAQARGGRVVVGPDLSVPGRPEVFVVGDAAAAPLGRGRQGTAPQLAQGAIQTGRHAGQEVLRRVEGEAGAPFAYRDKGVMATIGRHAAVAEVPRLPTVRGTLGWLAWLALHLVYLIGFRNRLVVLLNWTWRYFDWPSGPRLIVADVESETST
ncbi:MAG: NAD(P)/FAD-dependent oxidoreductase [Acidobacteriota bacterium]|nr:NAD(P)/FAD-dependent oxidoreductase [Acidobacteriota bacterium]